MKLSIITLAIIFALVGCRKNEPPSTTEFEMKSLDSPEDRVTAYIREWYVQWSEVSGDLRDVPLTTGMSQMSSKMKQWQKAEGQVRKNHFHKESFSRNPSLSLGSDPDHDPSREKIIHSSTHGNFATIETEIQDHDDLPIFHVYQLRKDENDWRIARIQNFIDPAGVKLFSDQERQKILASVSVDAGLQDFVPGAEEFSDLFQNGKSVKLFGESHVVQVYEIGSIQISSGVVGVYDPGLRGGDFLPLSRSVTPGEFPVEVAIACDTVIAARLVFDRDRTPISWSPAVSLESDNLVGIDSGNASFFDAGAFMAMEIRELQSRYEEEVVDDSQGWTQLCKLIHLRSPEDQAADCVVIKSGLGDGCYPCYWEVDRSGALVSLVIDFVVEDEDE